MRCEIICRYGMTLNETKYIYILYITRICNWPKRSKFTQTRFYNYISMDKIHTFIIYIFIFLLVYINISIYIYPWTEILKIWHETRLCKYNISFTEHHSYNSYTPCTNPKRWLKKREKKIYYISYCTNVKYSINLSS